MFCNVPKKPFVRETAVAGTVSLSGPPFPRHSGLWVWVSSFSWSSVAPMKLSDVH